MGRKISIMLVLMLLSVVSVRAQVTDILDQYIFSSETDSIILKEHLDSTKHYLITLYGDWCEDCRNQLDSYFPEYEVWQEAFDLEYIVLDDFISMDISGGLEKFSTYPYQAFATKRIRVELSLFNFPLNLLVKNNEIIFSNTDFTSKHQMEDLLLDHFPKGAFSIFYGNIEQEQLDYSTCQANSRTIISDLSTTTFGDQTYWNVILEDEIHFIRQSEDANLVYYYDIDSEEEHVLFDYGKEICDTLSIYSPSERRMVETKILNKYCEGRHIYFETDIPYASCHPLSGNYTLISGVGSNGGLIPTFDENELFTTGQCHFVDEQLELQIEVVDICENLLPYTEDSAEAYVINAYPNPSTGEIQFDLDLSNIAIAKVMDTSGKLISSSRLKKGRLNLKDLEPGAYFLFIEDRSRIYRDIIVKI